MKNATAYARKLSALLRRLRKSQKSAAPPEPLDPITLLVVSFLQWNATVKQAAAAHDRLMRTLVDNNDLRVSHPHEVAALLGPRYPNVEERAARMLDVLQEIFVREHAVSLDPLMSKPKKEARHYLDTLPGMPRYVAARVLLLSFGGHAVPLDDHLLNLLKAEGVADPQASDAEVEAYLERHVKAEEAVEVHTVLQSWADSRSPSVAAARAEAAGERAEQAPTAARSAKKTTKKKTSKRTSKKKPTSKVAKKK